MSARDAGLGFEALVRADGFFPGGLLGSIHVSPRPQRFLREV